LVGGKGPIHSCRWATGSHLPVTRHLILHFPNKVEKQPEVDKEEWILPVRHANNAAAIVHVRRIDADVAG